MDICVKGDIFHLLICFFGKKKYQEINYEMIKIKTYL